MTCSYCENNAYMRNFCPQIRAITEPKIGFDGYVLAKVPLDCGGQYRMFELHLPWNGDKGFRKTLGKWICDAKLIDLGEYHYCPICGRDLRGDE